MKRPFLRLPNLTKTIVVVAICVASAVPAKAAEKQSSFVVENASAMDKMMAGMNVTSSGDADVDFVATMIPHHQGAIDMALVELRFGKNERLRRLAQEIVVVQQQEIVVMKMALGRNPNPSNVAPNQGQAAQSDAAAHHHPATSIGTISTVPLQ